MVEGSRLFRSLVRPALLFAAGFALIPIAVEPIANTAALRGILFLVATTDNYDGALRDSDCILRKAINATNAYPSSEGICFGVTARLILADMLPNACLIGQSVRHNCSTPTNLEGVSKPCAATSNAP